MPLLLGQLVYTSFPRVGFRFIASAQVPTEIQQAFIQQVVHQHWDAYNPPKSGYRAAYLHQLPLEHSLFGWLYSDGMDDMGRCHVPYFVCYYLAEPLHAVQLENIFTCLQRGPVALIDQQNLPDTLETIVIPDLQSYQPVRTGVAIPSGVREQSHIALQQRRLLNLFVPIDEREIVSDSTLKQLKPSRPVLELSSVRKQPMSTDKIDRLLKELASKPIGIQGAVLVSSEGQPITAPIGMDENSVLIMAGTMLYLVSSTREEFNWQEIEQISVRGREGHVILATCNQDAFLLVKAGKALTGLLDGEINRTVKKLQAELTMTKGSEFNTEAPPELNAEVLPETENEIRHRGRSTSLSSQSS